ncbi:hypothetical protein ACQ4PT_067414 [Festuca glaucescens]
MDRTTRWPGLAPDVVRDVASRLHDAGDFVRLHAVCKPWRSSGDAPPPTNQFLPWLLAGADQHSSTPIRFRCIFSKSSYRAPPPSPSVSRSNRVGSADATAVRYIHFKHGHASLQDPLTREVTRLPQISYFIHGHWDTEKTHGIVYGDSTVLLYTRVDHNRDMAWFSSALLHSGEARWTLVDRILKNETPRRHGGFCTAYPDGRILILEDRHWRVVTPGVAIADDVLVQMPVCNYPSHSNYILESHGELLWVSVRVKHTYENEEEGTSSSRTFLVLVHALEDNASAPTKMQWVRKNGPSLADRVFFLGSPNSITMDSSQLGGHGGFVYFVYYNHSKALPGELFGVLRYNLIDSKTEFVERVPPGWDNEKCTSLVPQPVMSPIQVCTVKTF